MFVGVEILKRGQPHGRELVLWLALDLIDEELEQTLRRVDRIACLDPVNEDGEAFAHVEVGHTAPVFGRESPNDLACDPIAARGLAREDEAQCELHEIGGRNGVDLFPSWPPGRSREVSRDELHWRGQKYCDHRPDDVRVGA